MAKKILIVEDSKIINNALYKNLKRLGFDVLQAFTLKEAKETIKKNHIDLIILDLHLPDGEGAVLIAEIRYLTKTKVVVLTSTTDEDLREELFEFGIIDYIVKDKNIFYSINEVLKIIESINTKEKRNILVIDDSKFINKQIKTILEPRNYKITSVYRGKDGLKKIKNYRYDLIILDMELPDIHGKEVLKNIRNDKNYIEVPIIVLSGTATAEIVRDVLKNGASDYLKKPFVVEEFILKVDLWINYHKNKIELRKKTKELEDFNKNLQKMVQEEIEKNRKKDEIMFLQARYAQMGEMFAMIAHQWKQPLSAISAGMNILKIKAKLNQLTNELVTDMAEKAIVKVNFLNQTIEDFRKFFKPAKSKTKTSFKKILEKSMRIIGDSLLYNNINWKVEIIEDKEFYCYENEIIQVVLNILKNAEDAFIENKIKSPFLKIEIEGFKISISDNAGGIPEDIMPKIFDQYFSTKILDKGTGIGLYMSKVIIEEHCKGKLFAKNVENGTKFIIDLTPEG